MKQTNKQTNTNKGNTKGENKTMENKKTNKIDTTKLKTRNDYYTSNDVLQINSTIYNAKNSSVPFLNKKQEWLYTRLSKNELSKGFTYTLESLSNEYRKEIKETKEKNAKKQNYQFRKSFKSNEVFSIGDLKGVMQYFYIVNERLFEYYRNDKNNYILHEVQFMGNIATSKDRK